MENKSDPSPRDTRDLLLEVTASAESARALAYAIAVVVGPAKVAAEFKEIRAVLAAKTQGENHPDRYLELLEKQMGDITAALQVLGQTS